MRVLYPIIMNRKINFKRNLDDPECKICTMYIIWNQNFGKINNYTLPKTQSQKLVFPVHGMSEQTLNRARLRQQ